MKVLLDTNIIIHREANWVIKDDIGVLFNWIDRLHYTKCVNPLIIEEIKKNPNADTVRMMLIKLKSYYQLKTIAPLHPDVKAVSTSIDNPQNANDINDTLLINEVFCGRADILISEDKKIHLKASHLGLQDRVFKVETFIDRAIAENPELLEYKVLAVKKELLGNINLADPFFDSFREDYKGFDKWFNSKADDPAYIFTQDGSLGAFLFLKTEDENENYSNISPILPPKKRLKIGTLKVIANGFKLGERFLKIVFDNARRYKVEEIYVTIFNKRPEQQKLIELLEEFGFVHHGIKTTPSGEERVYLRNFERKGNREQPRKTFPWIQKNVNVFIVPIKPEYHTELFPDSILRTESPMDFIENEPHRNAISKVYICHSPNRSLQTGDVLVFYRSGGIYKGVATTIGIIESVVTEIQSLEELEDICKRRTALTKDELKAYWERNPKNRPFVINFLYAFSFKKRITLKQMLDDKILPSMESIKTINKMEWEAFVELINLSGI